MDGSALTAVLVPEGTQVQLPGGLSDAETAEQDTASGSTLLLVSESLTRTGSGGPDVEGIARRVAGEL
ncbi:hypothetical protein GCM10009675_07800 [Prauserella alba]|uniref:Uncharacterized protein n=1 Tax=Prauserella alba TaxID=176898 RepID=A0ABN1V540_9PSEU